MVDDKAFLEIAAIVALAAVLGMVGRRLRQPLLIMYLLTGILAGPACLGIIRSYDQIELLAQIGIALLLFIVGLKLDLHLIRTTGPVALATGLGQIVFTSAIGFGIAIALGMPRISAAYVAVALTFSSTIIIVKLLSDKKEIDSLHGQIAVGFLIVQDIAAIVALVALTTLGSPVSPGAPVAATSLAMAAKGLGLLAGVALLMKYVLPGLARSFASSQEMLSLFAVGWAVCLGAGSEWLGFTKEVGAFLAGISLASTAYRDAIGVRLSSLRDFLLLFFFIDLGARLDWSAAGSQVGPALLLSAFVLIGNPLIVMAIMGVMGYRRRTGFLAGLTVAQISEFSLIVAALGVGIGHIPSETLGLITFVGVVTISASTYMILYSGRLYGLLSEVLKVFERRRPFREAAIDSTAPDRSVDVILVGLGNYGSGIVEYLLRRGRSVIGVDFDPVVLERWRERGLPVLYGDMADPQIHEQLPLAGARWLVSTVRSRELSLALLNHLKDRAYGGKVAVTASGEEEVAQYRKGGAHVVFRPFIDAAEQAVDSLTHAAEVVPTDIAWPVLLHEVRIRSEAWAAGERIRDLSLRSETGVSILAVSRAGRVHYDPGADFRIYPGDRLVMIGPPAELGEAELMINRPGEEPDGDAAGRFQISGVALSDDSFLSGRTLADLRFRQEYGVTVVGIRRGEEQITVLSPAETLKGGDCLIVVGEKGSVERLKRKEPL